jgi:YQGE family putative transporter
MGQSRLTVVARKLLWTYGGAYTASAIGQVFVNLFLFVVARTVTALMWFNIVSFIALAVTFYIAAGVFRQASPVQSFRCGLVLSAAFYALLLTPWLRTPQALVAAGTLQGMAQGFYWFGANLMTFDVVDAEQRIRFFGLDFGIAAGTSVGGPLIGSAILARVPHLTGYLIIFALATAVYAVTFALSFEIPPGPPLAIGDLWWGFRRASGRSLWTDALKMLAVTGTYDMTTGLIGLVLLYSLTHRSWLIGVYTSFGSIAFMVASFMVSRWVSRSHRTRFMMAGALGMATAAAVLYGLHWGWVTVFVYGTGVSFSMPWFMVPDEAVALEVMDRDADIVTRRVAYMVSRETAINAGRIVPLLVLAVWYPRHPSSGLLVSVVLVACLSQTWVAYRSAQLTKELDRTTSHTLQA